MGNRTKKRKRKSGEERKKAGKDERKRRKKEKGREERIGKTRTSVSVQDKDTGIGAGNKEKIFIVFSHRPPAFLSMYLLFSFVLVTERIIGQKTSPPAKYCGWGREKCGGPQILRAAERTNGFIYR